MYRPDMSSNTTPKTTKRLGLSRKVAGNNSKIIPNYPTTPDSPVTSVNHESNPTAESESQTIPISFGLVTTPGSSVITSQHNDEANLTPTPTQSTGEAPNSAKSGMSGNPSANRARYSLSLCKQTNKMMARKRLLSKQAKSPIEPKRLKLERDSENFNANVEEPKSVASLESCDIKPWSDERIAELTSESLSETAAAEAALQQEIDEIEKKIATTKFYQRELSELQALIAQWRNAGVKTVEQMQEQLLHMEDETDILAHYGIDPGLFHLNLPE